MIYEYPLYVKSKQSGEIIVEAPRDGINVNPGS